MVVYTMIDMCPVEKVALWVGSLDLAPHAKFGLGERETVSLKMGIDPGALSCTVY